MQRSFQTNYSSVSGSSGAQGASQRTTTLGASDLQAERDAFLKYATSGDAIVISGSSDWGILEALKDAIIKLKTDFFSRSGAITIKN